MSRQPVLPILYQDVQLVAVNKPGGLLVHRSEVDRHETQFALQAVRNQLGQRVYPVHRLDKPTSGVLVFALDADSARIISAAITAGKMEKTYLAVVRGRTPDQDVIDYPLKEELDPATDRKARQDKEAQKAVTAYRRIAEIELPVAVSRYPTSRYSLLALSPKTGRKHQLRRHMKHIFHPVIGDTTHGEGRHNRFFREQYQCPRLLLHAAGLSLPHPVSGDTLSLRAPPDEIFLGVIEALGWEATWKEWYAGLPASPTGG